MTKNSDQTRRMTFVPYGEKYPAIIGGDENMLQLIMDTSNQYLMVALYEDDQCLSSLQEMGSKRQSENAIPYLQKLIRKTSKGITGY